MADLDLREQRLQSLRDELLTLELEAQRESSRSEWQCIFEQGQTALQGGDLDAAEQCFRALLQENEEHRNTEAARAGLAQVYHLLGNRELNGDRLQQAHHYYTEWAALDERNHEPRLLLAEIEHRLQKTKRRRYIFGLAILVGLALLWPVTRSIFGATVAVAERDLARNSNLQAEATALPTEAPPVTRQLADLPTVVIVTEPTTVYTPRAVVSPTPSVEKPTPLPTAPATPSEKPAATVTPTSTQTKNPTVQPTPTAQPLPSGLAAVVELYDIDPTERFLVAVQSTQQMIVWDPGNPVRTLPMSTGGGPEGYITPPWHGLVGRYVGTFSSFGTSADDAWYLYESLGSILIHGAPYTVVDGQKTFHGLDALGNYPASHGCIRLAPEDAKWLTAWGPENVPLVILPLTFQVDDFQYTTRK